MIGSKSRQNHLEPGEVIVERYEIVRLLGVGSFGEVYEGLDVKFDRQVAVKVLSGDFRSSDDKSQRLIDRFKREASSAGSLEHPAVVIIHDSGVLPRGRRPFMVMEYLDGRDLHTELKQHGPLAPARIIPLFSIALEALGEAHHHGIVHKDLKPENLFLTSPGTAREGIKIVDFGVAHVADDDVGRLTAAGEFFATANYISPEYMTEQLVTPQMDVYQMGLILVELLMGVPVVNDRSPTKCLMVHAMGQVELPASIEDSPLAPVVLKAIAFDHTERYANAMEFKKALDAVDVSAITGFDRDEPRVAVSDLEERLKASSAPAPRPEPESEPPRRPAEAPAAAPQPHRPKRPGSRRGAC